MNGVVLFQQARQRIEALAEVEFEFTPTATYVERLRLLPEADRAELIVMVLEESK
jgi:hypothetical protein